MKDKWLRVAEDMAALAESIKALAEEEEVTKEAAKAEPEKKVEKVKKEEKAEPEKKYTLEDVRKALADKAGAGFTAEIRSLLEKHGGSKLSQVPEAEYEAIMTEVKEIG
jgi:hypothetical protein